MLCLVESRFSQPIDLNIRVLHGARTIYPRPQGMVKRLGKWLIEWHFHSQEVSQGLPPLSERCDDMSLRPNRGGSCSAAENSFASIGRT